jgi:hypothetical protein
MNDTMEDNIFDAIKKGDVKMRPQWYFVLRDALAVIAIVIVLLVAVYLASFIIFVLHQSGAWFVPVFGLPGWFALFNALPWMLILLSALFVMVLALLVKRYKFSYQWPMLYSILGVIFLVAAACFVFIQSSFSDQFFRSSIAQDVPFLGLYYPGFGTLEPNDIHRGTIIIVNGNGGGFLLQDNGGGTSTIIIATSTVLPFGSGFRSGDIIVVFGERSPSGTINAAGVEHVQ